MNFDQFKKEAKPIIENQIKDGVDFIFEKTPELSNIGTKEIYSEYLDNVFPDSKIKDIIYRGVGENKEFRIKPGSNQTIADGFIFFAKDKKTAESYKRKIQSQRNEEGEIVAGIVNSKKIFNSPSALIFRDFVKISSFAEIEKLHEFDPLNFSKIKDYYKEAQIFGFSNNLSEFVYCLKNIFKTDIDVTERDFELLQKFENYRINIDEYLKNYDTLTIEKSYDNLDLEPFEQVAIAHSDQFHELGTKEDVENFKQFVSQKST